VVIFVDAAVEGDEPFFFRPVRPKAALSFSSHSLEPEQVLALAEQLFGRKPEGYALGIRGYSFNDFGEQLTPAAQANLDSALRFLTQAIKRDDFFPASAEVKSGGADRTAGNGD